MNIDDVQVGKWYFVRDGYCVNRKLVLGKGTDYVIDREEFETRLCPDKIADFVCECPVPLSKLRFFFFVRQP